VRLSKYRIEDLGQSKVASAKLLKIDDAYDLDKRGDGANEDVIDVKDFPIKDGYFAQSLQIGFDIFQYICVKISSDSIIDQEE